MRWAAALLLLLSSACAQAGVSSCPRPAPSTPTQKLSTRAPLARYYRRCVGGEHHFCGVLAVSFEHGAARVADHRALRPLFAEVCGTRFPFDPEGCLATALHARACRGGVGSSCLALAGLLASGRIGEPRERDARAALTHGCVLGDQPSCVALLARFDALAIAESELGVIERTLADSCERSNAAACDAAGVLAQRGLAAPPDLARARSRFERACALGLADACSRAAMMQRAGLGGASDAAGSLQSFTRACEGGVARACLELGRAVEHGRGTRADPARAFDHYRRGRKLAWPRCAQQGDDEECLTHATLLSEGSGGEPDALAAGRSLERGCRAGGAASCGAWLERDGAIVAGRAMIARASLREPCGRSDGAACFWLGRLADGDEASRAFARGCRLGHGAACNAAGMRHFPPDAEGRAQLARACALGHAPGCHHLAVASELPPLDDEAAALDLHRQACLWGHGSACHRLGMILSSGESVAVDMIAATRAYREGCDLGMADACYEAGVLRQEGVRVTPNPEAGRALLTRACRNGSQPACTRIALRRIRGLDGERDVATALGQLDASCRAGHGQACYELGDLFRRGRDVRPDETRAKQLFRSAAAASVRACESSLALCYPKAALGDDFARRWTRWHGEPTLSLAVEPACDQRLERMCNDATDALAASCELGESTCFDAAELVRRLARSGLGSGAASADELQRRGCKLEPKRCPK